MTPMIDIVFQLVVFFLLVLDLSHRRFEPVRLPEADQARPENPAPPGELIVNLSEDGRIVIDGRAFRRDFAAVEAFFLNRRSVPSLADRPVLIRADRSAAWIDVERLVTLASERGGATRLRFAAELPEKP